MFRKILDNFLCRLDSFWVSCWVNSIRFVSSCAESARLGSTRVASNQFGQFRIFVALSWVDSAHLERHVIKMCLGLGQVSSRWHVDVLSLLEYSCLSRSNRLEYASSWVMASRFSLRRIRFRFDSGSSKLGLVHLEIRWLNSIRFVSSSR